VLTRPNIAYQAKLLHGEQYLKIHGPIPTSGTLVNRPKLLEVLDKVSINELVCLGRQPLTELAGLLRAKLQT
jgi:hypothetical protein